MGKSPESPAGRPGGDQKRDNPKDEGALVAVARLGAPRGVSGHLKLHSFSGEFAHLALLKEVLLAPGTPEASGKSAAPGVPVARKKVIVHSMESGEWGISFQFEGYDSPEKARVLTGMEILVPLSAASPLREGEWYISDLIGLALTFEGKKVAEIRSVLDGAADPLLECRLPDGKAVLIPFRKEYIGEVDLGRGNMELLYDWLLE
ncbi:MAG: ribosome maturation factor RimM [Rectinema sp.]